MSWTILQIIPELSAGGAERTTIEIAEAVKAKGGRALVASAGGRLEEELQAVGGEHFLLPLKTKNPYQILHNAQRIECLMDAMKVDLIHARSRAPAWSAMIAARRRRVPFVTTYHGIYNAKSALKRVYNSVMARGDAVIANSEYTAEHLIREHQIDPAKVTAILRGVDLAKFDPDAVTGERVAQIRASWGLKPEDQRPVILHAARLTRWKGQLLALEAAARLKKTGATSFALVFIGDAQGREEFVGEMRKFIADNSLGGDVIIAGHCADMPAAFKAATIVIQPSLDPEAFGRSAAEAQAMAIPVVAAAHGGLVEVVQDGVTGLLVRPGDADVLTGALNRLLALPPEGRRSMGAAGMLRARRLFAKESLQEATLNIYAKLLGARHTGERA